jgi:hypothetical protein
VLANHVAAIAPLVNGLRPLGMLADDHRKRMAVRPALRVGQTRNGLRGIAILFVGLGIIGVLLPGIPGWPFLLVSIPMFAAGDPRKSKMDLWLKRNFPKARLKGLELTLRMIQGGRTNDVRA